MGTPMRVPGHLHTRPALPREQRTHRLARQTPPPPPPPNPPRPLSCGDAPLRRLLEPAQRGALGLAGGLVLAAPCQPGRQVIDGLVDTRSASAARRPRRCTAAPASLRRGSAGA